MSHFPDFETFCQLALHGNIVPVYRKLVSDTLTPVSAYCKIAQGEHSFLFESVIGGEKIGRYSFVGSNPFLELEAFETKVVIREAGKTTEFESPDPLAELQRQLDRFRGVHLPGLPRFCGGAVGYAGYDTVRYVERLPNPPENDRKLPDLAFSFYDHMIVFDNITKTVLAISQARTDSASNSNQGDLREVYDKACKKVDELCERLEKVPANLTLSDINLTGDPSLKWTSNFKQAEYEAAVEKCKEYIKAGDIFQVVLSQRLTIETETPALDIYRSLRIVNPSPFMFLVRTPHVDLVGSSPEIMVRVEDGLTTIRPLAGTRKRGVTPAEDAALAEELLADPKERAEHVMLVDLARNDVGRVAQYGSVKLSDVMQVERYSHVMHITSNVTGQLSQGLTALDALRAGLPAGTVSGAPKVRAMEIIDELERHRRGPYAGAVGYIDFTGNMDTCIALRTLVLKDGKAYVQAGAGIVADSVPEMEYQETLNKAKGILKAIEVAEKQIAAKQKTGKS